MVEQPAKTIAPVPWLPAGLISWYAPDGAPLALVTSWIALVGGRTPRIKTAWHGRREPLSCSWPGGDFVVNIPCGEWAAKIREVMRRGKLCLNSETDLGLNCSLGIVAAAPRLLECSVQVECVGGRLVETDFDTELCGEVMRIHRGAVVFDPAEIPDLFALRPLCPPNGA